MSRLIDADVIDFNKVFVGASEFAQDTRNAAQMLIDAQPTAYDVDKVVEQLESKRNSTIGTYNRFAPIFEQPSYKVMWNKAIDEAISIVKGGRE